MRILIILIPALLSAQTMYVRPSRLSKQHTPAVGLSAKWDAATLKLTDGAMVASWSDLSLNANTATQGTVANKPTFVLSGFNFRPSVRFTAASAQFLQANDATSLKLTAPMAIYYVASNTAASGYSTLLYKGTGYRTYWKDQTVDLLLPSKNEYQTTTSVPYWPVGLKRVIGIEFDGTNAYFWVNGILKQTINSAQTMAVETAVLKIGSESSRYYWGGDVSSVIMYKRILSTGERTRIFASLCAASGTYCSTATLNADLATATHASNPLTIATYDGSGQTVHPSVLHFASGWNGHAYWLAAEPYPASDATKENPCIYYSDDGTSWTGIAGNPVDGTPSLTYLSDGDIEYNPADGKIYLYYRDYTNGPPYQEIIWMRSSSDGTTWSARSSVVTATGPTTSSAKVVSPAIVYTGTQWEMYSTNYTTTPYTLERRTASAPGGTWSAPVATTLWCGSSLASCPSGWNPSHVDVTYDHGAYYAFVMPLGSSTLYMLTSKTGLDWQVANDAFLKKAGAPAWCGTYVYRASAIRLTPTSWDLWYSCQSNTATWGIGRTTVNGL